MTEQEVRIRSKVHLLHEALVVDPSGKALNAALGLGTIGDLRGHVGPLGALAAHDAADERGQRLQVSGEVPGGRRRIGVREGVTDGTITAKVVTHRRRLLLGGACWMAYTMSQPLSNIHSKMS